MFLSTGNTCALRVHQRRISDRAKQNGRSLYILVYYVTMKNIVVLGAGFGGLRVARSLSKKIPNKEWHIVLVDRNPYHLYYPKLYEITVPEGAEANPAIDVREILKGAGVEFLQGEAQSIDCKGNMITLANDKTISFEYLVLALGADTDFFGIEGLKEYGCTLKSIKDAEVIRNKITDFLEKIKRKEKSAKLDIVIGGAGATGVETAAELAYLFRTLPRSQWSITIVEALRHVLWMFPQAMSQYAHRRLEALGVHLMLDTCIKKVEKPAQISALQKFQSGKVEVALSPRPIKPGEKEEELTCEFLPEKEKRISADLLLWAGGIRSNPLLSKCGLPVDKKGRVEVDEHMAVKSLENIFAIGDNALLIDPATKQPVPAIAQAALLQGDIVAENIKATIKGGSMKLYLFPKFPAIVPLGNRDAVAIMGKRVIRGFPAWFLRQAADFRYYNSILPWWRAIRLCFFR